MFSGIVEQRGEGGIFSHHKTARTAVYQILFYIQPFVGAGKIFRLMGFYPFVFPHGVLDACGDSSGDPQAFQKLEDVSPGNLDAVGDTFPDFFHGPLVHIAHGTVDGNAVFVCQHKSLHLGAEGDSGYLLRGGACSFKKSFCGAAHGSPPFIGVLFGSSVF